MGENTELKSEDMIMCYLIGYSTPDDKCEVMWNDDYLGRIQNICATAIIQNEPHVKSGGIELRLQ
jgi:hypothetical protein